MKPSTLANSTKKQYAELAERLLNRVRAWSDTGHGQDIPLETVVEFLESLLPSIKPRTVRMYRAAITYHFKLETTPSTEAEERLIALQSKKTGKSRNPRKTSSQKSKHVSSADLSKILDSLFKSRNKDAALTAGWLQAALLTGLRPREWCDARLVVQKDRKTLVVKNLKNTNDRSHGETRTLDLTNLPAKSLEIVNRHLRDFRLRLIDKRGFDAVYTRCRQWLHKTSRKLFPKRKLHITLYTGRHQFAADAKRNYDKVSVAAILGHRSLETAGRFYGRASKGSDGIAVKPTDKDRQSVIQLNKDKIASIKNPEKKMDMQNRLDEFVTDKITRRNYKAEKEARPKKKQKNYSEAPKRISTSPSKS